MKLVRGTNVYPRAIEGIVRGFGEIVEFQVRLFTSPTLRDEIALRVEVPPDYQSWPTLHDKLHQELADAHEGLNFLVERAETGSLPRFELKARRTVDERTRR